MDESTTAKLEADDDGVGEVNLTRESPEHIDRDSQLTTSCVQSNSSIPSDDADARDARGGAQQGEQPHNEPEDPVSLQLEDLVRPTPKGSLATTDTVNSSWSQLPVAQPIDVSAHDSSMSLLPNSGVVQIPERGEMRSIRDDLERRASDRTNSSNRKSVTTASLTETSMSGFTASTQQAPHPHLLETTDELEAEADESEVETGSKEKISKKKKETNSGLSNTTLGIIAALLVLVITIIAGVCLSGQCGGSDTNESPTPSPTVFVDRRIRIAEYIQSITESDTPLIYPVPRSRSPTNQEKALNWLLDEDPLELEGFANELYRIRQRFALSSIWFLTSPESFWGNTTNWLSGYHECDWANVICGESSEFGRQIARVAVDGIDLGANNIVGVIPEDLALLSDGLLHLQLAQNGLTGPIPSSIGLLTKLTWLDVHGNSLSGSVPTEIGKLSFLQTLRLGDNEFEGTLPDELGLLTNVRVLNIINNQFTGTVPSWLGKLSSMRYLWFQDTLLSGTLPSSLASWQDTNEIFLFNTRINGTIPFCEAEDPAFFQLVADCNEVECSCCTACCPQASGSIPVYGDC